MNVAIWHDAKLANTHVTISSSHMIGMSTTVGFGVTMDVEVPGAYCSYAANMNLQTSKEVIITNKQSYTLCDYNSSQCASSGTYYLYYQELSIDSIVVKMDNTRKFISAEKYSNSPEGTCDYRLLKIRPTTISSIFLFC